MQGRSCGYGHWRGGPSCTNGRGPDGIRTGIEESSGPKQLHYHSKKKAFDFSTGKECMVIERRIPSKLRDLIIYGQNKILELFRTFLSV
ncbi:hypothetical protein CEXT_215021 [Caerostris extrusa]|uniref:Uncharacterized protein n=1 Tax=Caerostris extrusa TaxID=172846 RepID=A0AAV4UM63_CAEEX|nr:hypothetical protein CEXT_215021 [Caerostris extrusa]